MTGFRNVFVSMSALALAVVVTAAAPVAHGASPSDDRAAVTRSVAERAPAAQQLSRKKWEKKILKLTNKQRVKHDCKPLKRHNKLRKAARKHTNRMVAAGTLSHQLPGEPDLGKRVTVAGYRNWRGIAENIAYGYPTPKSMVTAWMKSRGHRENILNCSYRHLGVGVKVKAGTPWATQDFGHK